MDRFSLPNRGIDHVPTVSRILPPWTVAQQSFKRRVARYDRKGYLGPANATVFREIVAAIPATNFNVEADTHVHIADDQVQRAAITAFGPPVRVPKQPYISVGTPVDHIEIQSIPFPKEVAETPRPDGQTLCRRSHPGRSGEDSGQTSRHRLPIPSSRAYHQCLFARIVNAVTSVIAT